jgi:hypothetical protein
MNNFNVSSYYLSQIFWDKILSESEEYLIYYKPKLAEYLQNKCEGLRDNSSYNTGTISFSSAWILYSLVSYFKTTAIAEIGTFIGKSTLAMAKAQIQLFYLSPKTNTVLYTCDSSNEIDLPNAAILNIVQYKNSSSTQMLEDIKDKNIDMFFIDGRLRQEDLQYMEKYKESIIVVDDFEGIEKGVTNIQILASIGFTNSYVLIQPPTKEKLNLYGLFGKSTIAILLPLKIIQLTSQ